MDKTAKFNIGDWIQHVRKGYRGVVVDVDPLFQASGRFNPQALTRAFATRNPWYRVLVDGSNQLTYVEECEIETEKNGGIIDNPNAPAYLEQREGRYYTNVLRH